jgi:NAD(P)-dependent dehydrogenase (short-subunit alcohol dehydrogenase family)
MKTSQIWLVTGISSGFGQAIADAVLAQGHFLIGTFRKADQVDSFNQEHGERAIAYQLDLTQPDQIRAVTQAITDRFGRLDVLVNNAGYGFAGAVEETAEADVRAVFEANFFGTLTLTQSLLPLFRQQRSGHIVQISSHGGIKAFAGFGIYNASKFALEGMSEALAAEIAPLGIRLTIVEPGPFRTGFAGSAFGQAETRIADYDETAGVFRARMASVDGKQEGDPAKAAQAILHITTLENPPLRLPLGKIALGTIGAKLASVQQDLDNWRAVSAGVVFEE